MSYNNKFLQEERTNCYVERYSHLKGLRATSYLQFRYAITSPSVLQSNLGYIYIFLKQHAFNIF